LKGVANRRPVFSPGTSGLFYVCMFCLDVLARRMSLALPEGSLLRQMGCLMLHRCWPISATRIDAAFMHAVPVRAMQ
jgi:hypothetical protein